MAEIDDLEIVDASNTARFPEGQAPSTVNNGARALEGIVARWHKDINGSTASTGAADAYVFAANQTLSAYYDGLEITFDANFTNGGTATLNVDAVGAATIKKYNDQDLASGDIESGQKVNVIYDGTNWQLQTPVANSPGALSNVVEDTTPQLGGDLDLNGNNIDFPTTADIADCLDEDNMATDSAVALATQQSIKAYADSLVLSQANQAAIEAETNENTYIPPDLIKHNPGIAKGWVNFTVAAATTASHNVASITDTATGDWTVNWNTNFSGTGYCVSPGIERTAGSTAADREAEFQSLAVGSTRMRCKNAAGSLDENEVAAIHVAVFGDQ